MAELPIAAITRIMKSAGAERVGQDGNAKMTEYAETKIAELTKKAMKFTASAKRKTVSAEDIEKAISLINE